MFQMAETNFLWVNCRSRPTSTFLISMKICRTLMNAMIVRRITFYLFFFIPYVDLLWNLFIDFDNSLSRAHSRQAHPAWWWILWRWQWQWSSNGSSMTLAPAMCIVLFGARPYLETSKMWLDRNTWCCIKKALGLTQLTHVYWLDFLVLLVCIFAENCINIVLNLCHFIREG
jgi:hypothetical protein